MITKWLLLVLTLLLFVVWVTGCSFPLWAGSLSDDQQAAALSVGGGAAIFLLFTLCGLYAIEYPDDDN